VTQEKAQERTTPGLDTPLEDALVRTRRFFTRSTVSDDLRTLSKVGGREADEFYRDRWSHDKVVRSTHGVNCTGSCSWKVYVKDGIITWEAQQTDYPSAGPDRPDYEPRGCPRGAAFSWYTYSPTRVRYPYVRGVLLQMYREAKVQHDGDPVKAWAHVVDHPLRAKAYKSARGKGGLVRASWDEATEMIAAAYVHTIQKWGPDRVAGFSPIPAMSMVSHASGARFTHLVGGSMLSFYDWYADLPVASPQVFGDQTDVPESGDWWDAGYLVMWGSNVPVTRTPDAHWMTEARYRGQKVVVVSPDYADNVKFADEWLPARPGTDAALALAMGHVILKDFFVDRTTPYFDSYVKRYTDLPMLVRLEDGRAGKLLTAEDLPEHSGAEHAAFKTVLLDDSTGEPVIPNGSLGDRFGEEGVGRWNLDLQGVDPRLSLAGEETVEVTLPLFGDVDGSPGETTARVPALRVGGHLVTTVYELMLARYEGYTPEWQEAITGVPAAAAARIAREFAANAEESKGRSMILMGAGTNHWFHSDTIYRSFLALTTLTGCQGVNGGGWAHYVGQEKVRPVTGHAHLANALDWSRPPRNMIQAAYWYLHTDQ
jgi:nitrate reductase alpha subunit